MAAAYDDGRQRQTTAAAYDDGSGGLRQEGDNGLHWRQTTAAAYDGGGSGLH
jgi:hypothetical protein